MRAKGLLQAERVDVVVVTERQSCTSLYGFRFLPPPPGRACCCYAIEVEEVTKGRLPSSSASLSKTSWSTAGKDGPGETQTSHRRGGGHTGTKEPRGMRARRTGGGATSPTKGGHGYRLIAEPSLGKAGHHHCPSGGGFQ